MTRPHARRTSHGRYARGPDRLPSVGDDATADELLVALAETAALLASSRAHDTSNLAAHSAKLTTLLRMRTICDAKRRG